MTLQGPEDEAELNLFIGIVIRFTLIINIQHIGQHNMNNSETVYNISMVP